MHYTFQHISTITELSQDVTKYYMNITSPKSMKYEIYKDKQNKKALTSYNRETREPDRGLEEKGSGWSTDDPRFGCATLISNKKLNTIQNLKYGNEGPGE